MISPSVTTRRKKEAQSYISKVIDEMALSDSDLKAVILKHVETVIDKCINYSNLGKDFQFSVNPALDNDINAILEQLEKDIFNIIYFRTYNVNELAFDKENEHKSDNYLLLFLTTAFFGKTIQDRITDYVSFIRSEVEAYVAAGIVKGLTPKQILYTYLNNIKSPYASPLIIEAFRLKGFKAERILNKGITFGQGKYISAFNNLLRLEQQSIFQAYNYAVNSIWQTKTNIIGWYTVRGSSYPCTICDDNIGVFHPKEEFFFGYHVRCCCIMLPIYDYDSI